MTEKTCNLCGRPKPLEAFYRHPAGRDGRLGRCKECHKASMNRLREENIEAHRARDNARYRRDWTKRRAAANAYVETVAGREAMRRGQRAYIARNPQKRAAHIAVGNSLRDGKLIRPAACEGCQQPGRLHAHHDDYGQPLDVRWLCVPCHETAHHGASAPASSKDMGA